MASIATVLRPRVGSLEMKAENFHQKRDYHPNQKLGSGQETNGRSVENRTRPNQSSAQHPGRVAPPRRHQQSHRSDSHLTRTLLPQQRPQPPTNSSWPPPAPEAPQGSLWDRYFHTKRPVYWRGPAALLDVFCKTFRHLQRRQSKLWRQQGRP